MNKDYRRQVALSTQKINNSHLLNDFKRVSERKRAVAEGLIPLPIAEGGIQLPIAEGDKAREASVDRSRFSAGWTRKRYYEVLGISKNDLKFSPIEADFRPEGPALHEKFRLNESSVFFKGYTDAKRKKRSVGLEKKKPFLAFKSCESLHNPQLVTVCSCNDWIVCSYCRVKRQVKNKSRIRKYLSAVEEERRRKRNLSFQSFKFITLTQKWKDGADIKEMLDLIQRNFRKLRNRKCWSKLIPTGYFVASYEISENRTNIHVHIVALGKFWDVFSLSDEWLSITKDSSIVDIRSITNFDDAVNEIAKYIVKDTNPKLVGEMEEFRRMNPKRRYLVTGRRPPLLDTIAVSEHPRCSTCNGKLGLHGEFKSELEAQKWLLVRQTGECD
jgi:hypothetical protein